MTSELMNMVAKQQLYKVVGVALKGGDQPFVMVDEGRLYAAASKEEALQQAEDFWTKEMNFDSFNGGFAKLIDRVGDYKVVLVDDRQA